MERTGTKEPRAKIKEPRQKTKDFGALNLSNGLYDIPFFLDFKPYKLFKLY
jgi:hypothetical protein